METPAFRLKQRTSNGVPYWDSDGVGILVVTDNDVIFVPTLERCGQSR